jgi:hypothetical protein
MLGIGGGVVCRKERGYFGRGLGLEFRFRGHGLKFEVIATYRWKWRVVVLVSFDRRWSEVTVADAGAEG